MPILLHGIVHLTTAVFLMSIDFNIEVIEEECNLKSPVKVELDTEDLDPDILKEDIKTTEVTKECEKKRNSTSMY